MLVLRRQVLSCQQCWHQGYPSCPGQEPDVELGLSYVWVTWDSKGPKLCLLEDFAFKVLKTLKAIFSTEALGLLGCHVEAPGVLDPGQK